MSVSLFSLRPWSLLVAVSLLTVVPAAHALSARDKARVEAIEARMAAAEKRYSDALVLVNNADPKGTAESDAALEDMEDVITACIAQKGCTVSGLPVSYTHLTLPTILLV